LAEKLDLETFAAASCGSEQAPQSKHQTQFLEHRL